MDEPRPAIALALGGAGTYGEAIDVAVRIGNPSTVPLVLLAVRAAAADGVAFVDRTLPSELPAELAGEVAQLEGTLFVEDIGPQARLPMPPRWEWRGEERLVCVPVLAPGDQFELRGRLRLSPEVGECVRATVRYAPLAQQARLLRLVEHVLEPLPAPPPGSFGWAPALRLRARLQRQLGLAPGGQAAEPVALRLSGGAEPGAGAALLPLGGAPLPVLYRHALTAAELAALPAAERSAEAPLQIVPPPVPLAEARRRAGIAHGPAVHLPAIGAWVLQGRDGSALVSAELTERLPGRLAALGERLLEGSSAELTLFEMAPAADPDGLVQHLRAAGLQARSEPMKGEQWRGVVEVRAPELLRLVRALAERGLEVQGLEVRQRQP
ncbi:MAG: hypothetical protein KatS3mg102_0698 [Planctomycetota bacterium]|nr:MAG: hypothetical protein KatS3mg102_0698 [Planctomycetota bacterium]